MTLYLDDREPMRAPPRRRAERQRVAAAGDACRLLAFVVLLATLLAGRPAAARPCDGALPEAPIETASAPEKFALIAQQCDVLAEPGEVRLAPQLELYDRGASTTIRMSDDPAKAQAAARAASAPKVVLDRNGRRVLAVAPALLVAARTHGIDPLLLHAIAHVESRHDAGAVSPAGARGVMQVMPDTGRRFGVKDAGSLLRSETNLQASAAYLRVLRQRYGDDWRLVLAAYNAGEGAVDKHGGVPPYPETQAYVRDVLAVYQRLQREFAVSPQGEIVARAAPPRRPS
jgi:soluble lytic murein transglycosylase-like protein